MNSVSQDDSKVEVLTPEWVLGPPAELIKHFSPYEVLVGSGFGRMSREQKFSFLKLDKAALL